MRLLDRLLKISFLAILFISQTIYSQTIVKNSVSSFALLSQNDSLTVVAGEASSGSLISPQVKQGYLPLFYSSLTITDVNSVNFQIYPNPFNDYISIQTDISEQYNLKMFDICGKSIYENSILGNQSINNLDGLANGIYFVTITQNSIILKTVKIIKN